MGRIPSVLTEQGRGGSFQLAPVASFPKDEASSRRAGEAGCGCRAGWHCGRLEGLGQRQSKKRPARLLSGPVPQGQKRTRFHQGQDDNMKYHMTGTFMCLVPGDLI